ncbi:MAG: hypothetical protein ACI3ZO_08725, partial [Candidatus Cryptobacteroides sp.]
MSKGVKTLPNKAETAKKFWNIKNITNFVNLSDTDTGSFQRPVLMMGSGLGPSEGICERVVIGSQARLR